MTSNPSTTYSSQEKAKLVELRDLVADLIPSISGEQLEDHNLVRWLRARNQDVKKAEEMLRNSMKWRKLNNVDNILETESIPEEVKKMMPIAFCGISKDGYGAFVAPFGRCDSRFLLEKYGPEKYSRWNIFFMEDIRKLLKEEGEKVGVKVTQMIEVCDFEGYSYRQMGTKQTREVMAKMQEVMDLNYPELLHYCMIVNAPKIFAVLFQMLKPLIPKNTLDKIDVHGPDAEKWKKIVKERFPTDKIPPHWGGTLEGADDYCSGHSIWLQGPPDLTNYMHGLDERDADFTSVVIPAREKFSTEVDVKEKGTILEWRFKSENHDIGFQLALHYKRLSRAVDMVIPMARKDAHSQVQEGSMVCEETGRYVFTFDNSFSLMTGKTVLYQVIAVDPNEQEAEFKECEEFE